MSPNFQLISETDLPELIQLESICFPSETWTEKMLRTHLEFHAAYFWRDNDLKGYALICETPWEVEIFRIATAPTYQRQGVGQFLFTNLFETFPKKDFFLEVKESNESAIQLYKKMGFTVLETRKNYYPDKSTAIIMIRKPQT
ncbi:MAG: ribosomal protein S18-alanine N-acetyltransferase [Leptospira sp.]|nr:ribosomal protein S18-alanine N-acetyltransferase [Leptospira sp.]